MAGAAKQGSNILLDPQQVPERKELTRKRDRECQKRRTDAARKQCARAVKMLPPVKASLRPLPLKIVHVGARLNAREHFAKHWCPYQGAAIQLSCCGGSTTTGWERIVIGVHADAVPSLLAWISPKLLHCTGAELAARGSENTSEPRGASIILSFEWSTSGPHRDGEDSLLFAVSGQRHVYFAETVPDCLKIYQEKAGAPEFLSSDHDPILNSQGCGVQWEVHTLNAGDAFWIPHGWWHCVKSEEQSVAVPVEVVRGSVRGTKPRCFERVGQAKQAGRDVRMVSRRPGWTSAHAAIGLWSPVLQHLTEK